MKSDRKTKDELVCELEFLNNKVKKLETQLKKYKHNGQDTARRRQIEEKQRESEEKYRSLFNQSVEGIYVHDYEGRIIDVNQMACTQSGYTREELLQKNVFDCHPSKSVSNMERKEILHQWKQWQVGQTFIIEGEHKRKDGTIYPVEISTGVVRYGNRNFILAIVKDITDRKRTEESLRKKDALLANLASQVPGMLYQFMMKPDGSTSVPYSSGGAKDIFGCSAEDVRDTFEPIFNVIVPDDRDKIIQTIDESAKNLSHWMCEYRVQVPGKPMKWIFGNSVPEKLADGSIVWSGYNMDITERKRKENDLQREKDFIKRITETSPIGITRLDANGNISFANNRAEQILGLSKSELSGQSYNAPLFHISGTNGEDFPDEQLPFNLVKKNLKPVTDIQHAISWPDGRKVLLSINSAPLYNDLGQFDGMVSSLEDITEKKHVEEALKESESSLKRQNELFSALLENLKIGVFMVEAPAGKPLLANKMALKLLGRGILPDANKSNLSDVYKARKHGNPGPYPVNEMPIIRGMYGESSYVNDMVVERPDGSEIWLEVFGSSINDENGKTWASLVSFQDITERRHLEDQLRQIQKLEGLGTLAGGIAHDFNNILGIILAYNTNIKRIKDDTKKLNLATETITKAVERGKTLVQQVLTFARKTEVTFGPVNVNDVVMEIMIMIYETFPKTINCSQNLDKTMPCINADRSQLHQALLNLCVNARDAMPKGGVLSITTFMASAESLRNHHPEAANNSYVCIEVNDTGEGMDEDVRKRIFEPFFTTKGIGKGTGLGLSVTFGVIQSHKGYIDVQSELGRGTTFRIYLPATQVMETIEVKDEETLDEIPGGTETLLVVEDEEMLMVSLEMALVEKGYNVLTAGDGLTALKIYQENKNDISLVITDLGLPNMTGLEVCQRIKTINPDEHLILATGFLDPETKPEFIETGIRHFLFKPYDLIKVLKLVREVMDGK